MSARTEQPTPRRLREARRRGEVAASRDLTATAALLCGLAALAATAPASARELAAYLRSALADAVTGGAAPAAATAAALRVLGRAALPACLAATAGAAAAGLLQTGGLFAWSALRPQASRLEPFAGLARLASAERLGGVALGVVKLGAVLSAGLVLAEPSLRLVAAAPRLDAGALLAAVAASALRLALGLGGCLAALGAADLLLARRRQRARLMMTRDEVRREHKDEEGDPAHRAERRRLHRALASAPPLRDATCLVVNPTHFAVALRHVRGSDEAPVVVAKGQGRSAARLRAAARRAGLPIVRDVALARALHRLAEVGDEIPEELYEAAAAVLVHIHGSSQETP